MVIVRELQVNYFVNWRVNNSFSALVAKKEGEGEAKDFRPISLLHWIYKILAKALVEIEYSYGLYHLILPDSNSVGEIDTR